jgi:hypothetical protein
MDSAITRKEFCKHLASSLAAVAYPAIDSARAFDSDQIKNERHIAPENPHTKPEPLPNNGLVVNVKDFGAKGDGIADDSDSIQRAMRSDALIFFPAGHYRVSKTIHIQSLRNVHICATGAILSNSTLTNHLFQIERCEFVTITGGKFAREGMPTSAWPTDRHGLLLISCKDVVVQEILIDGSPGMGICIMDSDNVKILNNSIKNTTRDGVYSHYSVSVLYCGNYLENITDDALSIHDYGFNANKQHVTVLGYPQAGSSIITDNKIKNCIRGIASIGVQSLIIRGNVIDHVVTCGIDVYNTAEKFQGPDARAQDVIISNNLVSFACLSNLKILDKVHSNGNQGGHGKAAITVGSFSPDFQYATENKRLANISVTGNMVNYSGADAYFLNNIDGLIFSDNSARNCNNSPLPPYTGYIVECWCCTDLCGFNNNVTDSNSPQNAIAGYRVRDTTGSIGGWSGLKFVVHSESKSAPKILY